MEQDHLAESLNDLFTSISNMIKGDLQRWFLRGTIAPSRSRNLIFHCVILFKTGTNDILKLLENMNIRVAEEYTGFGDVASGLRVYVEQLKSKSGGFDEYVHQIDSIEQQVTEFEAVVSMLDKYVSLLETKMKSIYQIPPS